MDVSVRALGAELLDEVPELADRLVEWIRAESPPYGFSTAVTPEDLRRSCADNLTEMLRRLAGQDIQDPEAPVATGRRRAEQGFPLAEVLHAFRLGGRVIWDELVARARRAGPEATDVLVDTASSLWEMIDDYSVLVAAAYQERMAELSRMDAERRTLVVDAVLAGLAAENPSLPEAAAALGLPLHGFFLIVSVDPAAAEAVERAVSDELRGRGGTGAFRLRTGRYLGVVSLGPTVTAADLRTALEGAATARVGLSPLYSELTGTPEAVRLSDIARACLPPGTKGVMAYEDHPVRALLASDADAGWRTARIVLEPVLALEAESRELLLETLRVWFAAGGSAAQAAKALFCHRNTVRNRLQRIEELTGRSLEDPRGTAELFAASEAVSLLGPSRPPE
ncbi:MAG: helix-turn-helix domain-containing protein [Actinomycetota bacterium]|nr:helix-turn-helix domain-containing protein [Actinomycetota bacterium]